MSVLPAPRLILLHKHGTSGRVRFLCLATGVLAFAPLPALAALRDEDFRPKVQVHPTALVREAEVQLGMAEGTLQPEADFQAWVDTPSGDVPVLMGLFMGIEPPFEVAARRDGRFIALTESRHLTDVERQLLRRAYEHVLG